MRPKTVTSPPDLAAFPWALGAAYGTLWGLAVWSLETMSFAMLRWEGDGTSRVMALLAVVWITRGIALAWAGLWIASRVRDVRSWLGLVALVVALALSWDGIEPVSRVTEAWVGLEMPSRSQWLYTFWVLLVYGTPLLAFCILTQRARSARRLLGLAAAARAARTAAIDRARLDIALRRISPELLTRSLASIRAALDAPGERAGPLLSRLVAYLRAAMPGLRTGSSSLEQELRVLAMHDALAGSLDAGATIRIEAAALTVDPPFPPGILLSLVEAARGACADTGTTMRLGLTTHGHAATLSLDVRVPPDWMTRELIDATASALDRVHGATWRLEHGERGLRLTLPLEGPTAGEGASR